MSGEKCGTIKGDPADHMLRVIRSNPRLATGANPKAVQEKLAKALDWGCAVVARAMRDRPNEFCFVTDEVRGGVILFVGKSALLTA